MGRAFVCRGLGGLLFMALITQFIPRVSALVSDLSTTFLKSSRSHNHQDLFTIRKRRCQVFGVQQPFGEQQYWEKWYQNRSSTPLQDRDHMGSKNERGDFSWYSGWEDMRPFVYEFGLPSSPRIFIPGIGMDIALLLDMYQQDGYRDLTAMDYAPASIDYVRDQWRRRWQKSGSSDNGVAPPDLDLSVVDARDMPYSSESFDLILDKGTLDSVYLCGSTMSEREENLQLAVQEMQRVLKSDGGLFWSLSGICSDCLANGNSDTLGAGRYDYDWWPKEAWESCADTRDGHLFITSDGYTSNNLDGSLLVWRKK